MEFNHTFSLRIHLLKEVVDDLRVVVVWVDGTEKIKCYGKRLQMFFKQLNIRNIFTQESGHTFTSFVDYVLKVVLRLNPFGHHAVWCL